MKLLSNFVWFLIHSLLKDFHVYHQPVSNTQWDFTPPPPFYLQRWFLPRLGNEFTNPSSGIQEIVAQARVSPSAPLTFGARQPFVVLSCPVHCQISGILLGPYPVDARTLHQFWGEKKNNTTTTTNCPQQPPNVLRARGKEGGMSPLTRLSQTMLPQTHAHPIEEH